MTTEHPPPIRYVLYSHYPEYEDFETYRNEKKPPQELDRVKFLVGHLKGLQGLLTWPGFEGLLVLFYAPGLAKCLEGIAKRKDESALLEECAELKFARDVDIYLQRLLMTEDYEKLRPRLRFITALDLHKVFGRMKNSEIADDLESWIVGDAEGIRYDSPKIIEAIVRLRLLGSGVPVFRVDHDVLFRGEENQEKKNLEFSSTIGSCLTAYQLRRDSGNLSSFIFSASYDHPALLNRDSANDFHMWSRAFATRVFPALPVRQDLIDKALQAIRKGKLEADAWDRYAADSFSQSLARKFFGFDSEGFETGTNDGISRIGANPMTSVISGAMLYMSDGAILDLPPFSNFGLNVSWIDDHLKYCLHRELRHLSPTKLKADTTETRRNALLRYAKLDDVTVQKTGRQIKGDLRKYIFDAYLPTLLRGAIMDAWITPDPLLKHRPEDLSRTEDRDKLDKILREGRSRSVLASALKNALEECSFGRREKKTLERKLFEVALKRINHVRKQWRELTENGQETFASLWAKGEANSFPDIKLRYSGIAEPDKVPVNEDIPDVELMDGFLSRDLSRLVGDAKAYIQWTLNWPTIVQVVRSIEQGTLRTDLNFDPSREGRD